MRAIAWPRKYAIEIAWGFFALANLAAMVVYPDWETIPFHFVWISLTLVYGFRVWRRWPTALILGAVVVTTGASISTDAFDGSQLWGELFEVPLMAAMFLAMVWHAQRRASAVNEAEALVALQERFLHDVSHELRTPVTIARGHLELLGLTAEIRRSSRWRSTSWGESSGSSPGSYCSRKQANRGSSLSRRSTSRRSSKTSSCGGPRLRRAGGSSARSLAGQSRPTRRRCAQRSTRCSRMQ